MVEEKKLDNAENAPAETVEAAPLKGIVGEKIGMTRIFVDDSRMVPVTVIQSEGVVVTQVKSKEKDGYGAVQVGMGNAREKSLSKAEIQHLGKNKISPKRWLREFTVEDSSGFKVGQPVPVSVFAKGDWVQVSGLTKGKGYAGVIKRHGFAGLPHSHGNGEYRRHPGTSGAQGPQHVLPGTRKPGHKGHVWSTIPTMEVVDVDAEKNLILLRGSVPGPNGNFVVIKPTTRKVSKAADKPAKKK